MGIARPSTRASLPREPGRSGRQPSRRARRRRTGCPTAQPVLALRCPGAECAHCRRVDITQRSHSRAAVRAHGAAFVIQCRAIRAANLDDRGRNLVDRHWRGLGRLRLGRMFSASLRDQDTQPHDCANADGSRHRICQRVQHLERGRNVEEPEPQTVNFEGEHSGNCTAEYPQPEPCGNRVGACRWRAEAVFVRRRRRFRS